MATYVQVRNQYPDFGGTPATGYVVFTPFPNWAIDNDLDVTLPGTSIRVDLNNSGGFFVDLQASDDPDINPTDWTWRVSEHITGMPVRAFSFDLPIALVGPGLDLATVSPATPSGGDVIIQGPAGPTGPAGPAGPTGPTGPTGPAGPGDFFSDADVLVGETNLPRHLITSSGATLSTGSMRLGYFTARKTETINNLAVNGGGVAAAATPTLIKIGVYAIDPTTGNGTLVASTANVAASFFLSPLARYQAATVAPWNKVAGQRYAVAILVVSSFTMPSVSGWLSAQGYLAFANAPRITGLLAGQTDLPASFTAGAVVASGSMGYVEMLP